MSLPRTIPAPPPPSADLPKHGAQAAPQRHPGWRARLRHGFSSVFLAFTFVIFGANSQALALCADLSGDGFIRASDALAALRATVSDDYDPRADVAPDPFDDKLTASDALAILQASVAGTIPRCRAATETRVGVSTASFVFDSGGVAVVDMETHTFVSRGGAFHGDSVIRSRQSNLVGINRLGRNSLEEIDTTDPELPSLFECSVADGFDSNPYDVLWLSENKAYVTVYEGGRLLVVDPRQLTGGCSDLITGHVNLTGLADSDLLPEMDQMVEFEGQAYVSLQLLRHIGLLPPAEPARLAIIDTATDTVSGSVQLEIENPFAQTKGLVLDEQARRIYLGGPGLIFTDLTDGGIEAVDLDTNTSLGVLINGTELGGDLFDFVIAGTSRAYAVVAEGDGINVVVEINLAQRKIVAELLRTTSIDGIISDIELSEAGELWVAVREESDAIDPGLRVFSIADNSELTSAPIFPGSLPFTLTFLD